MDPIRVLIIDDSAFMRKMITEILESDQRIEVVGIAKNGKEGLRKINELSPDVVTLDVEMPVMDGMTTLETIMIESPLPVVMLASKSPKGSQDIIQAISKSAVDFILKPSGPISLDIHHIKEKIIEKVIIASQAKLQKPITMSHETNDHPYSPEHRETIFVIGSSTGGPRALQRILTELPSNFPAPILIVQHMPTGFTRPLANRLNSLSAIQIKEATDGEKLKKGVAYIAPGDFHMRVQHMNNSFSIKLTKNPDNIIYRPAVDVLFQSIATLKKVNKIAIILTGMGKDGTEGIKKIKDKDSHAIVIAESEESAIIYGMPKAAISSGYVDQIIHLHKIAPLMQQLVNR